MVDRTATAIQNAAQVVEDAAHVDVGNIDVPMLLGQRRDLLPKIRTKVSMIEAEAPVALSPVLELVGPHS
jgi:hypothetical protein